MKAGWILPDRSQTGTMLLDHGVSVEPLHEAISLTSLPRAFTLGIPEELFVPDRTDPVFFMQFARLANNDSMFSASLEAGRDVGDRAVVLTLLVQLHAEESIRANCTSGIDLPNSELESAKNILDRLNKQFSEPSSTLNELLSAVLQFPDRSTFASETLRRSANRPDWMKKKTSWLTSDDF